MLRRTLRRIRPRSTSSGAINKENDRTNQSNQQGASEQRLHRLSLHTDDCTHTPMLRSQQ